ncbi:MAG: light-harvesting antenna LH1, alpha subunit [Pseudomonadota bacterium]
MWRLWMMFDPRRAMIGMFAFLFALAVFIHFVLLSSPRYNWFETAPSTDAAAVELVEPAFRVS